MDHGAIATLTRSRAKNVQSVQLHSSSTSQRAQFTADPVGVVPAYSSEIAGVNSKDLVLQLGLPKILTGIESVHALVKHINCFIK